MENSFCLSHCIHPSPPPPPPPPPVYHFISSSRTSTSPQKSQVPKSWKQNSLLLWAFDKQELQSLWQIEMQVQRGIWELPKRTEFLAWGLGPSRHLYDTDVEKTQHYSFQVCALNRKGHRAQGELGGRNTACQICALDILPSRELCPMKHHFLVIKSKVVHKIHKF